jgi:hypothetical protein
MIKGKEIIISEKDVFYFSGGDKNSPNFPNKTIHTDLTVAQRCGLNNRRASGAMFEGILTDLMIKVFGDDWWSQGAMRIKFIEGVTVGDAITPYCLKTDSGYIVWCENQHRVKTCIGLAIMKEQI